MHALFQPPADTTKIDSQTFVDAGLYRLVADPHELGFAQACAELASQPEQALRPLGQFAALVRRARGALFMGKANQAQEWMKAIAIASGRLEKLGAGARLPAGAKAGIPIELHSHGFGSFFRELGDLVAFAKASSALHEDIDNGSAREELPEFELIRAGSGELSGAPVLAELHPLSAMTTAKIHALVKVAGPCFLNPNFGPGTERIMIGTSDMETFAAAFRLSGEILRERLGLCAQPEPLGKAFALLHETFHLSQSWESSKNSKIQAFFPASLGSNALLAEMGADRLPQNVAAAGKYVYSNMGESYADIMAATAIAEGDPKNAAKAACAASAWRDSLPEILQKTKLTLAQKAMAKLIAGMPRAQDPHNTQAALRAFAAFCESARPFQDDPQGWKELAKEAALAGLIENSIRSLAARSKLNPGGILDEDAKKLSRDRRKIQAAEQIRRASVFNAFTALACILDEKLETFPSFCNSFPALLEDQAADLCLRAGAALQSLYQKHGAQAPGYPLQEALPASKKPKI